MASFEAWRMEFLETQSPSDGAEIPELYRKKEFDQIEQYVTDELEAMEQLFTEVKETTYFEELRQMRHNAGYDRPLE